MNQFCHASRLGSTHFGHYHRYATVPDQSRGRPMLALLNGAANSAALMNAVL